MNDKQVAEHEPLDDKLKDIQAGQLVTLDDLLHYGVKGMKWGVRRDRAVSAARKSAENFVGIPFMKAVAAERAKGKPPHQALLDGFKQNYKNQQESAAASLKEHNINKDGTQGKPKSKAPSKRKPPTIQEKVARMSDEELKKRIDRLSMEKRLIDLEKGGSTQKAGKSFMERKVEKLADKAVDKLIFTAGGAALAVGVKVLGTYMNLPYTNLK